MGNWLAFTWEMEIKLGVYVQHSFNYITVCLYANTKMAAAFTNHRICIRQLIAQPITIHSHNGTI